MELEGKVAIVTGGSRGIGRAVAQELAAAGARVVINYRKSAAEAEALCATLPGSIAVQGDVATTEGCERLISAAAELGPLEALVNNAGITQDNLLMRMRDEQWQSVMDTNAGGVFRMCRAAMPTLVKQRSGSIVNVISVSAIRGNPGQVNYSASKAAILGLTRSLAREIGRRNIRVNAVAPGFVETDMTKDIPAEALAQARAAIPLGRLGRPEDIAPMIRFLCGPGSLYVTGQCFVVDGGLSV